MAALTKDRNTLRRDGEQFSAGVAATTKIYSGSLAALNSSGYAVPASDLPGLVIVGRSEELVDNSTGANGDLNVEIRRGVFNFSGTGFTIADVGKPVFVLDDQTVQITATTNNIFAGIIVGFESATEVWISVGLTERSAGARANVAAANAGATYTAAEQTLLNELKTVVNDLLAKLRAAKLIAT